MGTDPFTIESFYRHVREGRLTAVRCVNCNLKLLPPRPLCPRCLSTAMEWIELKGKGRIITFTVITRRLESSRIRPPTSTLWWSSTGG